MTVKVLISYNIATLYIVTNTSHAHTMYHICMNNYPSVFSYDMYNNSSMFCIMYCYYYDLYGDRTKSVIMFQNNVVATKS